MLRERKKEKTRAVIVQQAVRLFKQKGFHHVTVEEITEACGIAKGTFFNYYPRKESILLDMGDAHLQLLNEIVGRHRDGDLKSRLLRIFREFIDIYTTHSELLRLTLAETVGSALKTGQEAPNLAVLRETIGGIVEEARTSGTFRSRWDSDAIASLLMGILLHTLTLGNDGNAENRLTEMCSRQVELAWGGIQDD